MSTGRHAAPSSLQHGRTAALQAVAPAALLLAVGVVAVVCLLVLDDLGTGGRVVGSLAALWALVVGGLSVRHAVRTR